jgi:hypothetical protein
MREVVVRTASSVGYSSPAAGCPSTSQGLRIDLRRIVIAGDDATESRITGGSQLAEFVSS